MRVLERIQAHVGDFHQLGVLDQLLQDATRDVIAELPVDSLTELHTELTDSGSGVSIDGYRVLEVRSGVYKALRTEYTWRDEVDATTSYPHYYIHGGTLKVLPSGGTVLAVALPTIKLSDTTVSGVPDTLLRLIVIRAARYALAYQIRRFREVTDHDLTLPTAPSAPSAPAITYTPAAAATVSAASIGALPAPPSYSAPAFGGDLTAPAIAQISAVNGVDGIAMVVPTVPDAPTITYSAGSASTVTPGSVSGETITNNDLAPSAATPSSGESVTPGSASDPTGTPAVADVTDPVIPYLLQDNGSDFVATVKTAWKVDNLALSSVKSAARLIYDTVNEDIRLVIENSLGATSNAAIPSVADVNNLLSAISASIPTLFATDGDPNDPDSSYDNTKPGFALDPNADFVKVETALDNNDFDEARARLAKIGETLNERRSYVDERYRLFETQMVSARELIAEEIQKQIGRDWEVFKRAIDGTLDRYVAEVRATVDTFGANTNWVLALFRQDSELRIAEFRALLEEAVQTAQVDLQLWSEKARIAIANANEATQAAVAAANNAAQNGRVAAQLSTEASVQAKRLLLEARIEIARSALQAAQTTAQLLTQANEVTARLATDVSLRNAAETVRALLENYQLSLGQSDRQVAAYVAERNEVFRAWEADFRRAMEPYTVAQKYQLEKLIAETRQADSAFQGAVQDHMRECDRLIRQGDLDMEKNRQQAQMTTDVALRNALETTNALIADWQADIQLYQAQFGGYSAQVTATIEQFRAEGEIKLRKARQLERERDELDTQFLLGLRAHLRWHTYRRPSTVPLHEF